MTDNVRMSVHKKEALRRLCDKGNFSVILDPKVPGVIVPPNLRNQSQVVLNWGVNVHPEIPDLVLTDRALCGTLSFRGKEFHCTVPWDSVRSMTDLVSHRSSKPTFVVHDGWQVTSSPPRGQLRLVG